MINKVFGENPLCELIGSSLVTLKPINGFFLYMNIGQIHIVIVVDVMENEEPLIVVYPSVWIVGIKLRKVDIDIFCLD